MTVFLQYITLSLSLQSYSYNTLEASEQTLSTLSGEGVLNLRASHGLCLASGSDAGVGTGPAHKLINKRLHIASSELSFLARVFFYINYSGEACDAPKTNWQLNSRKGQVG